MCWKINQVDAVRLLLCWDKMLPVPSLITVMCGEVNITRGWPHWPWMSAVCHLLRRPSHRAGLTGRECQQYAISTDGPHIVLASLAVNVSSIPSPPTALTSCWPHWPWMSAVCHLLWRPSHRALACRVFSSAIIRLYLIMHASENTIHHAAGCNLQLSPRTELQNTLFFSTTFPSPLWISWYLSYSQTFTAFLFSRLLT